MSALTSELRGYASAYRPETDSLAAKRAHDALVRAADALDRKDRALRHVEEILDLGKTTEPWAIGELQVIRAALKDTP